MSKSFEIGPVEVGAGRLFLIAGPCVIESEAHVRTMADALQRITADLGVVVADGLAALSACYGTVSALTALPPGAGNYVAVATPSVAAAGRHRRAAKAGKSTNN